MYNSIIYNNILYNIYNNKNNYIIINIVEG
jgi:hypothetical protein